MALTDILNKLGGQNGEQGGMAAISKLFEGEGMQGILSKLQASGLDKQVMSWVGHGQNEPVTGLVAGSYWPSPGGCQRPLTNRSTVRGGCGVIEVPSCVADGANSANGRVS